MAWCSCDIDTSASGYAEVCSQHAEQHTTDEPELGVRVPHPSGSPSDASIAAGSPPDGEKQSVESEEEEPPEEGVDVQMQEGSIQLEEMGELDTMFESDDEALESALQQSDDMAAFVDHGNLPW